MHQILKVFILVTAFSLPSNAEELRLLYNANYKGLKVAEMKVLASEKSGKYEYKALIRSSGILKVFTKYRSNNISKGKLLASKIIPIKYFTEFSRKKEHVTIDVSYKNNGKLVQEAANPPENRDKRPVVDAKYKNATLDPISGAFYTRKQIIKFIEDGAEFPVKFSVPIFDARRRFDVDLEIVGYSEEEKDVDGNPMLEIKFKRRAVHGFNEKELKRMETQEPDICLFLDKNFIPIHGYAKAPAGFARISLAKICTAETKSCEL